MQTMSYPQSGPLTPAASADAIQDGFDSLASNHLGAAEPTYAAEGMLWVKEVSSTLDEIYFYDGTNSILVASFNPTTHALIETELADNQVVVGDLEQIAQGIMLGRSSASTGNVEKLTSAQVMAMLPDFVGDSGSGGTAGRVPAPAAGDAAAGKFLKANGAWTAPPSGTEPGAYGFFAMEAAPSGWLECYGQNVSRATYANLFAAIGITHGAGNGSTTFTLPDLRGRVIAGWDLMGGVSADRLTNPATTLNGINGDTFAATGGHQTHSMTALQNGPHTHTAGVASSNGSSGSGPGAVNSSTGSSGSGDAHNNVQPTIIGLGCIKY